MFLRQKIEADPHLALHQRHSGGNGMSSLSSDFNDARGPASPFHWTGLPIESDMNFFPDFAVLIHALRKCSVPSGRAILPLWSGWRSSSLRLFLNNASVDGLFSN